MILLLLLLCPLLLALNYTEEQRMVLLQLPDDVRKNKVRLFGDEQMIMEDVKEMVMRSDRKESRWMIIIMMMMMMMMREMVMTLAKIHLASSGWKPSVSILN